MGGLQAQQTHDPYIGLWSRLRGFQHESLTALITDPLDNSSYYQQPSDRAGLRSLIVPLTPPDTESACDPADASPSSASAV